jgi:DNA-binding SARP family transcriptional activator
VRKVTARTEVGSSRHLSTNKDHLTLAVLGEFSAQKNGKPITITSKKNRALLAILALSPHLSASRDWLASLLWSDRDDAHARSSLRQSLKLLRKELGRPELSPLIIADETISLASNLVEIDALGLLGLTEAADAALPLLYCRGA